MIEKKELPHVAEVTKALDVAGGSAEAAQYLCVQFEKKVFALKLHKLDSQDLANQAKLLQGQLNAFAKYVACQLGDNSAVWTGKADEIKTAFEKLQTSLASEGAKAIESSAHGNEYTMHIAVSNNGEVLRAYTAQTIAETTEVFNAEAEVQQDTPQSQQGR